MLNSSSEYNNLVILSAAKNLSPHRYDIQKGVPPAVVRLRERDTYPNGFFAALRMT